MKTVSLITILQLLIILSNAQPPRVVKITDLLSRIKNNSDTTYIINFWATWCVPCVKELPAFDSINTVFKNNKVKIILVSMDFKEDVNSKLVPFIIKRKIKSEVMLLDETDGNYFIPKISDQWSGSLPATLIVNNNKHTNHFYERVLDYQFLEKELISKN